jgi:GxxExxY protein
LEKSKLNQLSSLIIKGAINVHKELGPGLLESVYRYCLAIEFEEMGLMIHSEVPVPICYRGQIVHEEGLRLNLLVEATIVVELKSVEKVQDVHKKQLLTYLRLAKKPLGLLINFNEPLLKDGITRIINTPDGAERLASFFLSKIRPKTYHLSEISNSISNTRMFMMIRRSLKSSPHSSAGSLDELNQGA